MVTNDNKKVYGVINHAKNAQMWFVWSYEPVMTTMTNSDK
jgi:hypothetical protein